MARGTGCDDVEGIDSAQDRLLPSCETIEAAERIAEAGSALEEQPLSRVRHLLAQPLPEGAAVAVERPCGFQDCGGVSRDVSRPDTGGVAETQLAAQARRKAMDPIPRRVTSPEPERSREDVRQPFGVSAEGERSEVAGPVSPQTIGDLQTGEWIGGVQTQEREVSMPLEQRVEGRMAVLDQARLQEKRF